MLQLGQRLKSSLFFFVAASALVALALFILLQVWFPGELRVALGIPRIIFVLGCGAVLIIATLSTAVGCTRKTQKDLRRGFVQVAAIVFLCLLAAVKFLLDVRPVYLAFEGDRFRVVEAHEIVDDTTEADSSTRARNIFSGPQLLGVKLLSAGDPGYADSVLLSAAGLHPSFRQSRWLQYADQKFEVLRNLKPLTERSILESSPSLQIRAHPRNFGFLPLVGSHVKGDWIVLIRRSDGEMETLLPLDGW